MNINQLTFFLSSLNTYQCLKKKNYNIALSGGPMYVDVMHMTIITKE